MARGQRLPRRPSKTSSTTSSKNSVGPRSEPRVAQRQDGHVTPVFLNRQRQRPGRPSCEPCPEDESAPEMRGRCSSPQGNRVPSRRRERPRFFPLPPNAIVNGKRRRKPPGATTRGGWGAAHQRRRAAIAPIVNAGKATCARCGEPIHAGEEWHLDHNDARDGYLGVSHASCNLAAGADSHQRPQTTTHFGSAPTGGHNAGTTTRPSAPSSGARHLSRQRRMAAAG